MSQNKENLEKWIPEHAEKTAQQIEEWYGQHARDFLWRQTDDPYVIAISEVFLKRTQAERVNRFISDFLESFPDPLTLAAAEHAGLKETVAPLGLARQRTRSLKGLAEHVHQQLDGAFPRSKDELEKIPGIGDYTAAAVACFAFGQRCTIVDTNTIRVFKRLADLTPTKNDQRWCPDLRRVGQALVEHAEDPKKLNWGLLDLGAKICKPKPLCEICPVNLMCWSARRPPAAPNAE